MNKKPQCIIVTGRQGSGKTTLARLLARHLRMPPIIRDEIKEGYVNTVGIGHDLLPSDTNAVITDLFFRIVEQYLLGKISVVIEAAFQHGVWESRMPGVLQKPHEVAVPHVVLCSTDISVAALRQIERGLADPEREFYHGDQRVAHYRNTGEILPPSDYTPPRFDVPTFEISTNGEYLPSIDALAKLICSRHPSDNANSERN